MSNELSCRIRKRRLELGFQSKFVAEKLGISLSTYSDWEQGRLIRDHRYIVELSRVLSMSLCEILTGRKNETAIKEIEMIEECVKNLRLHF